MDQIRTLIWLKIHLTLALYRKRKSTLVSLLITLPFSLAFSLGLFFAALVAFWTLPLENNRQLLNAGLTAVYAMWIFGPLLGVSLNEGYDVSKLMQFPVSGRRIFTANILGSAIDPPVLMLMVPLCAIPIALGTNAGARALISGVVLLFLLHTVALSQALATLLWGLLKSRRVADFWKVFAALAGTIFWAVYQLTIRQVDRMAPSLLVARPSRFTQYLPSGLAADAVAALSRSAFTEFAWRAALLAAICVATVALAGTLVQRVSAGDLVLDRVAQGRPERARRARRPWQSPRWLSASTAAMVHNELRIFARDPQAKVEMLRQTGGLILMPIIMLSSTRNNVSLGDLRHVGPWLFVAPMGAMVLLILSMASNVLAKDRIGLSLLFTMPVRRMSILVGKNIAMLLIFSPLCASITLLIAGLARHWSLALPAIVVTECLMLIGLAEGNVFSVFNPMPLPEKGRNPYTSAQGSALIGCAGAVAGFVVFVLVASPLVPAFLAPAQWISPVWFAATLPASIAYSTVVYWLVTRFTSSAMEKREPEILRSILKLPA
ncbi:MAG TPA: hypothetical protein VGM51_17240 [Armatimonadota bacterium]|jgi:hypothetical protein